MSCFIYLASLITGIFHDLSSYSSNLLWMGAEGLTSVSSDAPEKSRGLAPRRSPGTAEPRLAATSLGSPSAQECTFQTFRGRCWEPQLSDWRGRGTWRPASAAPPFTQGAPASLGCPCPCPCYTSRGNVKGPPVIAPRYLQRQVQN